MTSLQSDSILVIQVSLKLLPLKPSPHQMVQNGQGEGKLALITIGVCFIGLLFQLTMPKLKLFHRKISQTQFMG